MRGGGERGGGGLERTGAGEVEAEGGGTGGVGVGGWG